MAITKSKTQIKLVSGNNFKVYYNSAWITLGNIMSGMLTRAEEAETITLADGDTFEKRTTRKCNMLIELAQMSKEILDTLDGIFAGTVKIYYYNGVADSKYQEIYAPEAEARANFSLKMDGKNQQILTVDFSLFPQSSSVSVTPNTGLPSDKYATGASPVTGTNPFYMLLETSV